MFKIIVAGGRLFDDYNLLKNNLLILLKNYPMQDIEIVSGRANGADSLGERFAHEHGCKVAKFPADWNAHGKSAGYRRNADMAEYADACVCFWDGKSKGTKHMIDLATKKGIQLRVIKYRKESGTNA